MPSVALGGGFRPIQSFVNLDRKDLLDQEEPGLLARVYQELADGLMEQGGVRSDSVNVTVEEPSASGFERNLVTIRAEVPYAAIFVGDFPRPTDEERAQWARETAEAWNQLDALVAAGAAEDDTLRALLDLHAPATETRPDGPDGWVRTFHQPVCLGCTQNGYDSEEPEWPCATWETYASQVGLPSPNPWRLTLTRNPDGTWARPPRVDATPACGCPDGTCNEAGSPGCGLGEAPQ